MGCGASTPSFGPIHQKAIDENWPDVITAVLANVYCAREKDMDGELLLHLAARYQAPLEVASCLLEAYPEGAREKNKNGFVPLHLAALFKAPLEVVRCLLEAYPEGVCAKVEPDGHLPLHYAAMKQASLEVVACLVAAYAVVTGEAHGGANIKCGGGLMSLDVWQLAEGNDAPKEVTRALKMLQQGFSPGDPFASLVQAERKWLSGIGLAPPPSSSSIIAHAANPINAPGVWDVFISHSQRDPNAVVLAEAIRASLKERSLGVWLDVKMENRDEAAMEEGAKHSMMVIAIVTDGGSKADNAFFNRSYCLKELRWARSVGACIQPVVGADDKKRIGEFIGSAPDDLKDLGSVDWVHLDRGAVQYWDTGMNILVERLEEAKPKRASIGAASVGHGH